MMPRPCRTHIFTDSALRACAHTRTARPRVARDVELQEISALPYEEATDLTDLVRAVGDPGKGRCLEVGQVERVLVAEPARHRDFRAIGEIARAGNAPGLDLVADHDVE